MEFILILLAGVIGMGLNFLLGRHFFWFVVILLGIICSFFALLASVVHLEIFMAAAFLVSIFILSVFTLVILDDWRQ